MRLSLTKFLTPTLLCGALLFSFTTAARAQSAISQPHSIDARERRQQRRINQGIRNGELTRREARHLEKREAKIGRDEARDRRDGDGFTARERRRLQREENRTSRAIYRQKHDRQENERREERHETP